MSFGRNWLRYYRGLVSVVDLYGSGQHNLRGRRGLETVVHELARAAQVLSDDSYRLLLRKITGCTQNNDDRVILQFDGAGGAENG